MNNALNERLSEKKDMSTIKHPRVFFSNRLETLFQHLVTHLFAIDSSPFTERIIIVPNKEISKWLKKTIAAHNSLGILMGCNISFLGGVINHLLQKFCSKNTLPSSFSHADLVHLIYNSLEQSSIQHSSLGLLPDQEIPYSLIKHLALLFKKYDLYGTEEFTEFFNNLNHWQNELFQLPKQCFPCLSQTLEELLKSIPSSNNLQIFLFGFSYLPCKYFNFFEKLSTKASLFFYQLSPCRQFWTDQTTDKAVNFLIKKWKMLNYSTKSQEAWLDLTQDHHHPFLANMGSVVKKMTLMIENTSFLSIEDYHEFSSSSHLKQIQNDLLDLEISSNIQEDDSLQLHVSETPLREIEILFNHIGSLFKQGARPSEIVVITEKINIYAPLIKAVFDILPIRISGLKDPFQNNFLRILHKIHLLENRAWDYFSLHSLLFDSAFSEKAEWNDSHKRLISYWLDMFPSSWGFNHEHRQQAFHTLNLDLNNASTATWEDLFEEIFSKFPLISPFSISTDPEAISLLGNWVDTLSHLYKFLEPLRNKRRETLTFWRKFLLDLGENFFSIPTQDLEALKFFAIKENNSLYSFNFIFDLLQDLVIQGSSTVNINNENAITFGTLQDLHGVPYKHVCLIGFDGKLAQVKDDSLTDFLKEFFGKDPAPTQFELACQMFLDAILSARETLFISYVSSNEDAYESTDHRLLELKNFASLKKIVLHPLKGYSSLYFTQSNFHQSFIPHHFRMAQGAVQKKTPLVDFFSENAAFQNISPQQFLPKKSLCIHVRELQSLLLSPLNHFFHHSWGSRSQLKKLQFHPRFDLTEEEVAAFAVKQAGQNIEAASILPTSLSFASPLFKNKASSSILSLLNTLNDHTNHASRYNVLLSEHHSTTPEFIQEKNERILKIRPPEIYLSNGSCIKILGKIGPFINNIRVIPSDKQSLSLLKFWPEILILELLNGSSLMEDPFSCLLVPSYLSLSLEHPYSAMTLVQDLLEYYFIAASIPSPLLFRWLSEILKKNEASLDSLIHSTVNRLSPDQALFWFLKFRKLPLAKDIIQFWEPIASSFLSPLFTKNYAALTTENTFIKKPHPIHSRK
ncbi:exodeoxyribonuclease V subunit gamma [Candidatus Clavichlamydia salmonicola]|uniref:exodeoxyribonuclease V subunit gamma n=1 Tax=Candidatus Clavichlamydia salmonicola TaxID=469812 RepID=UPI001891AABB|nr:exodeoxyribonuclease V subunit gamma [Candidatus Clavichlamydia salmonicola]